MAEMKRKAGLGAYTVTSSGSSTYPISTSGAPGTTTIPFSTLPAYAAAESTMIFGAGYYAGIGSRKTPPDVRAYMRWLGKELALTGFTLRSGGAVGADAAFEEGCDEAEGSKYINIPWNGYNGRSELEVDGYGGSAVGPEAESLAEQFHPAWKNLSPSSKRLIGRNSYIILGNAPMTNPRPVAFVLCWTPGGEGLGGTGQALRIAHDRMIPVFDFGSSPGPYEFDRWYGRPFLLEFKAWQETP